MPGSIFSVPLFFLFFFFTVELLTCLFKGCQIHGHSARNLYSVYNKVNDLFVDISLTCHTIVTFSVVISSVSDSNSTATLFRKTSISRRKRCSS